MHAPHRHGLLIGINRYPMLKGKDLNGCVNDARLMQRLLADRFGFAAEDLELVLDEAASRDGILAAMARLRQRVGPGDEVVVFYAGHGSRVGQGDEVVESMVAADSGRGAHPNRDVFDHEVLAFLAELNAVTRQVTLIFDCCHSGSVTRDASAVGVREVPQDTRSLADVLQSLAVAKPADVGPGVATRVLACRADELAAEYRDPDTGEVHGAMTWFLARTLAGLAGPATWREVFNSIAPRISARFPRQHPILEGAVDGRVFDATVAPRPPHLTVVGRDGDDVVLSGGALHGVTPGSRWRLSPTVDAGTPVEATVRAADGLRARAPAPAAVEVGWRAEAEALCLAQPTLQLALAIPAERAADAAALALECKRANRPKLLEILEDGAGDVTVYLLGPRAYGWEAPCPALGALDAWTWAAVGRDGRLAVRPRPATGPEALAQLVDDLIRVARFRGLLSAEMPDQSARLAAGVTLAVRTAAGEPLDGLAVIDEGDACEILIHNRTDATVYLTLLEFGTDQAITSLLPYAGHPWQTVGGVPLEPGKRLALAADYFSRDDRFDTAGGLPLHLPADFPWAADPGEEGGVGQITYRLLVTEEPVDFSFLEQAGTRSVEAGEREHPLADRLGVFHTGLGSRSFAPRAKRAEGPAAFAIVEQTVRVRREPPPRQISPSTGGKVLFYKVKLGGTSPGQVAISHSGTSILPPNAGFWGWLPTASTGDFTLTPDYEVPEDEALSAVAGATQMTNPKFPTSTVGLSPPSGMSRSWEVRAGTSVVAHMALVGSKLFWYSTGGAGYLPQAELSFKVASLPASGTPVRVAIDVPL